MATSAWSTEAWTDTQASAGGVTDLTRIRWQADWSAETNTTRGYLGDSNAYGMWWVYEGQVDNNFFLNGRKAMREDLSTGRLTASGEVVGTGFGCTFSDVPAEEGTEMWTRVWCYHTEGFLFTTDPGTRKWFRQREVTTSGSSQGYADFNIDGGAGHGSFETVVFNKEGIGMGWLEMDPDSNGAPIRGVWECYEQYVRSSRNNGIVRWWKNGVLLGEHTGIRTKVADANRMNGALFVSIWNSGLPQDQTWYWCAPAVAMRNSVRDDTPHMARDARGNFFIGTVT